MRIHLILLSFVLIITSIGCSKDAEVGAFISEFDAATNEIVEKVNANPTSAGIDEAQRAFDVRKPTLKARWENIKDTAGFQVSGETKKKLETSMANNMKALTEVSMKNMMKMAADKEASVKFRKLLEDYSGTFALPG